MDQTLINWLLGGFGALIGFLLNAVWQAVKDLQAADKSLVEKVSQIEVLVAGAYVKKDEFQDNIKALFAKLDKIEDKIDRKADK
jgi:CHASE3 domain sensor protein